MPTTHPKTKKLLYSPKEAAAMLGISVRTLRDMVKAGEIRFILIGKRRRFAMSDIEEFIDKNRVSAPAPRERAVRSRASSARVYDIDEVLKAAVDKLKKPPRKR